MQVIGSWNLKFQPLAYRMIDQERTLNIKVSTLKGYI